MASGSPGSGWRAFWPRAQGVLRAWITASSVPFSWAMYTLDGLDQVGDQVVAPLELDVDLGVGVLVLIPADDQAVVHGDQPEEEQQNAADGEKGDDPAGHAKVPRR